MAEDRRTFLKKSALTATVLVGCADDKLAGLEVTDGRATDAALADSGSMDAGAADALADATQIDADEPDVGEPDAGESDAAEIDSGAADAAEADASMEDVGGPSAIPESANFPLGIASGDVTTERAILWTKYSGSMSLELVVWIDDGTLTSEHFATPVAAGSGGFIHEDVEGLTAGDRYAYAFFELDGADRVARTAIGRFRAAIADTAMEPLVIGACCCTSNGRRMETLEKAGARSDLDTFLLLGDTTYNDGATTLSEYEAKWAQNLSTDGYKALRSATSVLATWDDHEVTNNFDPETINATQLSTARRAFFDHLPLRRDTMAPDRIWKSIRWGHTAEVFVLDCRGERKPSTRQTPQAEYISPAQMDWLKASLSSSPAVFKVIMNSVPIADLPPLFDVAIADRWDGYSVQWDEILEYITMNSITGVVWISGDIHLAYAGKVKESGPGSDQLEILAGPGAQVPNPLSPLLRGRPAQFDWASGINNYLALHLDPSTRELRAVHHDADDMPLNDHTYTV